MMVCFGRFSTDIIVYRTNIFHSSVSVSRNLISKERDVLEYFEECVHIWEGQLSSYENIVVVLSIFF